MFKAQREQILQRSIFRPFAVNVLDAWKDEKGSCSVDYKTDSFPPECIPHWIEYDGEFSRRRPKIDVEPKGAGVIRLLLCETPLWHPLSFSMTKEQFCAVDKEFDLPAATLPLFESRGSVHTWSIEGDRFYFVMKVQQQNPIANYGLSFCHRLKTGITTGILYGQNLTCQQEWYGTGYSGASRVDEFLPQLKELGHLIDHPLLLPILLLSCDIRRAQHFCMTEIEPRLLQVEEALRVTRPGQIMGKIDTLLHEKRDEDGQYTPLPFDEDKPYYQRKPKMIKLMTEINTLTTESLIALCVPSWQTRFAEFLATFFDESANIDSFPHEHPRSKEMKDMMNHFSSAAANNMDYMQQLKSRMELQLQVLYQFMTQTDNHLNATLAAAATRDSSAMKTLAFLTALFLPGTYVATLFSMDMFNWAGSDDSDGNVNKTSVSSSFWIYWIVTGILTFAVIGGWRLWWKKENRQYKEQYKTFLGFLDKKNDEQPSSKSGRETNGYHAAREESEDDDNDEDDHPGGIGKLRGGASDSPATWLNRAGHALRLDHLGMWSNRSVADGGTEAGPASTHSDLAVDVEAGLERPAADDVEIDCSAWAEKQPPEQQHFSMRQPSPEERHLTIPPKNARRRSRNVPARHLNHPYYPIRQPDQPVESRNVSWGQSGTGLGSGVNIPSLPPPPPPPPPLPPRPSPEPLSSSVGNESPSPEHVGHDENTTNATTALEGRPQIKQYWSINRPPGGSFDRPRPLPTPPPGAKRWMPKCGNDDFSWVDSPGMKERMGAEVWEYMKLLQERYANSPQGRSLKNFHELSRSLQPFIQYFERSALAGRLAGPDPCGSMANAWREFESMEQKKNEAESAAVPAMSDEMHQRQSQLSQPPHSSEPQPTSSQSRVQLVSGQESTPDQWYDQQRRKYLQSSEDRDAPSRSSAWEGNLSADISPTKQLPSGSEPVLGEAVADAEGKEFLENEPVDQLRPRIQEGNPDESDEEELYSLPQPVDSSRRLPPPPAALPAGPLVVVPGQIERRASLILSPHLSNDAGVCSPRFPTYQEPLLFPDENNATDNNASSNGPDSTTSPKPPPNLPDPSPEVIQQRLSRLSTHPPVVRRLSEMGLQAQKRGASAAQVKRWKEWHLSGLARQWCRLQQRQQHRHLQRASGGGDGAVMVEATADERVGGDEAAASAGASSLRVISPLSPLPPIRLDDSDLETFAGQNDVVFGLQKPPPPPRQQQLFNIPQERPRRDRDKSLDQD
ncbi:hypothetical protein HDK90DRAFT_63469 [Phyllosticta capitalensis]|uniref:Uncharacterized protein n=1 Tax=Phyllosticta capitalensis TaxID=121624 RepID=A0ABR1YFX9_9PEZI